MEDPVHRQIILDPIAAKIIKTRHFKRLEKIRQLGFVYKICENANHRRYEHCIGTYHLAGKFLDLLEENSNPKIEIKEFHKQCVKLAGLLHDIAHGPFSHFWEHHFNHEYVHEKKSAICIDKIFEEIEDVDETMRENGVKLIKSLIEGNKNPSEDFPDVPEYLFEIINNVREKIDVDKWDYIKRDYYYCKELLKKPKILITEKDIDDVFLYAKVSEDGKHIDYGDESKIDKLFEIRSIFHRYIYRLPEVEFFNAIIKRSLKLAHEKKKLFKGNDLKEIEPDNDVFFNLVDDEIIKFLNEIENISDIKKYMKCYEDMNFEKIDKENKSEHDVCVRYPIEELCYFRIN